MAVTPMLAPNNAVLTTATIEVAVLRLDKRQVTQAVFRQVPERSPISADGGLIDGATPGGSSTIGGATPRNSAKLRTPPKYDDAHLENLFWHRVADEHDAWIKSKKAPVVKVFGKEHNVTTLAPNMVLASTRI